MSFASPRRARRAAAPTGPAAAPLAAALTAAALVVTGLASAAPAAASTAQSASGASTSSTAAAPSTGTAPADTASADSASANAAAPAPSTTGTVTLAVGRPAWATAAADRGALPSDTTVTARIYLASQNRAGLAAFARAVSDPSSPSYGHYLSPTDFAAEYGPSAQNTATLTAYLAAKGITVTDDTPHYLDISARSSRIDAAFGTTLHDYATANGVHHAPTTADLHLPAGAAAGVLSVAGLDGVQDTAARPDSISVAQAERRTLGREARDGAAGPGTPASGVPEPCSTHWGQYTATGFPAGYTPSTPTDPCSYVPSQLREAYGVTDSGLTGSGATIAIVDAYASSTMLADANQYSTNHGDQPFAPGQYSEVVTPGSWELQNECGGPAGWAPEEALDVEMAHGYAPDANVVYVGANSCSDQDFLAAWQTIVDKHLADVVSNSWGEIMHGPTGYFDTSIIAPYEQVLQQGAAEGIGFNASTGDCADSSPLASSTGVNCDPNTVVAQTQWPATDPWVTAVGATALAISNSSGRYDFETSMGDLRSVLATTGTAPAPVTQSWSPLPGYFYFGGGGGTSADFAQPWYQRGIVPNKMAHTVAHLVSSKTAQRTIPDVAMEGDLVASTLVGLSDGAPYSEDGYGGTSVSSPSFAGILADAIQARGGIAPGFANPMLYQREYLFNDVVDHPRAAHLGAKTISAVIDFGVISGVRQVRLYAMGQDFGLNAVAGYDEATGLGTPTEDFLLSFE